VVIPYFTLDNEFSCPVITLTKEESLAAVTRIFATINTTGKRLTPIEIVTATLYAHDINLKKNVLEFQDASDYLKNMDPNGEILLQTIALLADKSPKKSLLPKTVTHERFKAYFKDALDLLDRVGEFLTKEMGSGLKYTNKLIPYSSILAPMAVVFNKIKDFSGSKKRNAEEKVEKWFVGSAISQRYQEGVHNKQENDTKEILKWIDQDSDDYEPIWLKSVQISKAMKIASPNGAIGRLFMCLINRERVKDPLDNINVGYYEDTDEYPQAHHIWPHKFCADHLTDWDIDRDETNYVLNIIPVSSKTNRKWNKMDPKNQISDINAKQLNKAKKNELFKKLMLSDKCVQILERPNKTKKDYNEFIAARFEVFNDRLSRWNFSIGEEEFDDAVADN
jgi:hypothetical protein